MSESASGAKPETPTEKVYYTGADRLMSGRTFVAEVRAESHRCLGITKKIGLRLARHLDVHAPDWLPDESFVNKYAAYTQSLCRLMDAQARLEREARLRLEKLPKGDVADRMRSILERQVADIVEQSVLGANRAKRSHNEPPVPKRKVPVE